MTSPVPSLPAVAAEAGTPLVDVRGPRLAAWLTSGVLAPALVTGAGRLAAARTARTA